jgi:hypothetical protein
MAEAVRRRRAGPARSCLVADRSAGLAAGGGGRAPTLFGFDFSFAPPIAERGEYLPGEDAPADARRFWAYVDRLSDDEDLGAASFLERVHRRHFYFGAADGAKRDFLHHRVCEQAFNATGGGKASTVYDAIGAAQVAKASFAGMRCPPPGGGAVWPSTSLREWGPTAPSGDARPILALRLRAGAWQPRRRDLHARLHRLAALSGRKVRTRAQLDAALIALGSRPASLGRDPNDHESDVLIAAAGLRSIAGEARYWSPAALTPELARSEGWTFARCLNRLAINRSGQLPGQMNPEIT